MASQATTARPVQEKNVSKEEQASREHAAQEKANQKSDEDSLTTVLTLAQRTQLIVLLAAATANMRDSICHTFDAKATASRSSSPGRTLSEDDKIMNPNIDPGSADVEAHDRERKMIAAREKELSAPRMQELKTDVLTWFDKWREAMIGRVGEVLKKKKDAKKVLEEQDSGGEASVKPKVSKDIDRKIHPEDGKDGSEEDIAAKAHEMLKQLYPKINTPLVELADEKRVLILHAMLLILLSLENYAAPSRILLLYLVNSLQLPITALDEDEKKTAQGLLESTKELSGKSETEKHAAANEQTKKWKVGLATVAGAAIVGISGGMAAPLVAAGVSSVMGGLGLGATAAAGYLGSVAGSTLVVGGLFGAYGGKMTGKMMENYAREVSDFAFIPIHNAEKHHQLLSRGQSEDDTGKDSATERRLRVTIGITGWLTEKEEIVSPWKVLGHQTECFALRWELEALMNLGNAISAMVSSAAWGYARKEIIAHSIFADMMAAMWPLGLVQLGRLVDNPFSIAKTRAEKAGAVLADALVNKAQGERPVTLIGYSLGARVIYACLLSLAARKEFGLIDSVVLIGSPIPSEGKDWRAMRSVVSGRLVNVFSQNDYVLGFLYRTSSIQLGVAGLQKIQGVHGVENIDVSDTVSGHLKYRYLTGAILRKIGFEDLDLKAVEEEEEAFKKMEEEEKRRAEEIKKKVPSKLPGASYIKGDTSSSSETGNEKNTQGSVDDQGKDRQAVEDAASKEADDLQKGVHEKTQKTLMERGMEYLSFSQTNKGSEKVDTQKTGDSSTGGYLGYVKNALPFGTGKASAESKSGEGKATADPPKSEQTKSEPEKQPKGRSYLEMATESGANVGSAASNLYQGARSRISWGASKSGTTTTSNQQEVTEPNQNHLDAKKE